jgi:hypothetical protein
VLEHYCNIRQVQHPHSVGKAGIARRSLRLERLGNGEELLERAYGCGRLTAK